MKKWIERIQKNKASFMIAAALVVFVTTYTLILPALTIDRQTAVTEAGIALEENDAAAESALLEEKKPEEPVSEAVQTAEADPDSMPAQEFREALLNDRQEEVFVVSAVVPEGTLPADTEMKIEAVDEQEVLDEILDAAKKETDELADSAQTEINDAQAVDISFWKDGKEIEPEKDILLTMSSAQIAENDSTLVVHVNKEDSDKEIKATEGKAEVIPQIDESRQHELDIETASDEVIFESDKSSVYGIVGTTIEKIVLANDGHNYHVTATYGDDTGIPADAELSVEEMTEGSSDYDAYVEKTESALGLEEGSTEYIRLFDISIVKGGEKLQPAEGTSVDVRIELADSSSDRLNVIHFADGSEEGEEVRSSTENSENGAVVAFQADGFSVYSIVDAPEPKTVSQSVNSLDEIEAGQKYLLSIARSGMNYMTSTTVKNGGIYELKGDTNNAAGEKWSFEFPEAGKVYIYFTDPDGGKQYLNVDNARNISFSNNPQALNIEETKNAAGTFYIYTVIGNKNYALSVRGNRNFFFEQRNNGVNANERVVLTKCVKDLYELEGKTFGIAYNDDSTTAAAMSADKVNGQNRLAGQDLVIRADVLNNSGNLLVAENSDIQEWTFEAIELDKYYIKTTVDGAEKYLRINYSSVTLVDDKASASQIRATPGTDANSGKWHFTVNGYSLNFSGSAANGFNAVQNSNASTWLNLVEKSTLSDDDFVAYSARKISVSDDSIGAGAAEKARIIVYTRVWNETTRKYEFYAVDHDGSLIRVYDSGDMINWTGNKVNSALWEFTEYTNADGTPNYYYELQNTAYTGTYLAPQSESIIADHTVGINMNGRREGFDFTTIVAWDDEAYGYSGLKIERDEKGALKAVTCPFDEADDFYFAVMTPPVGEEDDVTTVETVDNNKFGISIKMIDFNNRIDKDNRDTVQREYFGHHPWNSAHAYEAETGLVSTNLVNGYPTITANTEKEGESLSGLFNDMTPANHLFIQSVYNESGYFEYDSTQNFAHFNTNKYGHEDQENLGNFTVYNQLGAIGTNTGPTRLHGQFMPFNNISDETGYAHDDQGNVITNQRDIRGNELPDTDPRKGEPLYSIPQNEADYFYGMELSAVFTQTPDGVDDWGHDIIFEFTGDDDFWFYVDGELVLDLGGVHSAIGGTVNFRTGEVNCNGTETTLYDIFRSNYQARGLDDSAVDNLFVTKTLDDGRTVHVFNDYTTHEMKMFYMERGGGASNLKMRFNLASVKPGTVELSKKLKGVDHASNKLIQYPYQIWYQTAEYERDADGKYVLDENGNRVITSYGEPVLMEQPAQNTDLTGKVYASYKGTNKLIPYKSSMQIGGEAYSNVFLLKAGETAVVNFPEDTYRYKIVECGVDTAVYNHVYINGEKSGDEIFGKPHNNTDGWDPESGPETPPTATTTYDGTTRSDFGITYDTTRDRPRVEYINEVPPEVMRTVSFKKVLYDTEGKILSDEQATQIKDVFTFRLYLGNEFADQENLLPANMYTYYVKGPDGNYCKWDKAHQEFVSLDVGTFEEFKALSEVEQDAGTFTTSMYGSVSKIPAGYTVEVRDLIVGTKYKIEEPDRELPRGYTRRDSDGYVRTDTNPDVVYYTEEGTYGQHPTEGNTITAEPISDTIASKTESPMIEIRNQQGWGLTAKKEWTDKDFMIHDPIYLAVYLDDGNGNPGDLIDGSVRRLDSDETEIYWFFPDLKVNDVPHTFNEFIVREVKLTGEPTVEKNGVVTGYTEIEPIADGGSITVSGKTISGNPRTEKYTVDYDKGQSTGQNEKIRVDTVTNSRPGIQIYKTDWSGQTYLSGAEFTLKDSEGTDVGYASYTSGSDGLVTTAYLNEGTFTLDEIKTPFGYVAMDDPIKIKVMTTEPLNYDLTVPVGNTTYYIQVSGPDGFFTTTPATDKAMARITVKNRTVEELKVVKVGVDGSSKISLEGVHFALYDQVKDSEGNVRPAYNPKTGYEDLVTNDEGILTEMTMAIGPGTYYLREKAAPSGYKKLAEDLCFTIGTNGSVTINNSGYKNWLTKKSAVAGTVSYQIDIENTPLGITVRKADESGNALSGSKFELCRKNDKGTFVAVAEYGLGENGLINLTDKSEMTFTGMANGIYKLTETSAPAGYVILTKDIYFKVSDGAVMLTDDKGEAETYSDVELKDDNTTIVVKNVPGAALPNTGGHGTRLFTILGSMMILGAGVLLWRRVNESRGRFF
ncbi:MAG: LPXTG cell wall anchor domain-containing protein [Lachnospiraceae bacterium]|nr:LPXTG cell wall anchor domain-containing protein [Lachnospiraceae bacterium]